MRFLSALLPLVLLCSCIPLPHKQIEPAGIDDAFSRELLSWLDREAQVPEAYVAGLFREHDVVFLGEQHRVKHDVEFVQHVLDDVYAAGVHALATEFARREDQPLVDSLLALPSWNEALAREIVFRQFVFWGYQEYVDVFHAAWQLNAQLPDGAPRLRVLGINNSPDWSLFQTVEDMRNPKMRRRVWGGATEEDYARVILDEVRDGGKVLVHCGIHHAFTHYRQPIVREGAFLEFDSSPRCGNYVFDEIGTRSLTVFLHAPWDTKAGYGDELCHPADGVIDALMTQAGLRNLGFDLANSPFGQIRVHDAVYMHGYADFKLADFCDGWIYFKPISEFEGVTPIPDWINPQNLARAQAQAPNPRYRSVSSKRFNDAIAADADIHGRWGYLR